MKLKKSYYT